MGGSSLAELYGLACVVRVSLRGGGWSRCVGWGAVFTCKRVPPFRQAFACHFRRGASALGCPKGDGSSLAPALQSLGLVARLGCSLISYRVPPFRQAHACHLPPRGTAFWFLHMLFWMPQGRAAFSGPCFAVAGIGGEVVGSLFMKASLPSLSLRDISPPREQCH